MVDTKEALSIYSQNRTRAIKQYLQFMEQEEKEIIYKHIVEDESKNQGVQRENKESVKEIKVDEIIEKVCTYENVTITEITKKTKIQKISDVRKAIVLLSEKYCNISNKILAQKLNLSPSMISKIKSGESKNTFVNDVIQKWEQISK